jgi:hypothetical protein
VSNPGWCPVHSSGPAPSAIQNAQGGPLSDWYGRISTVTTHVHTGVGFPLWLSKCNHVNCRNLSGPSEAGLVTGGRRVVCSRCGVARFCSADCASKAWRDHSKVCGRLAAALGRTGAANSSSSRARRSTAASSASRVVKPGTVAAGGSGSDKAAATGQGTSASSSNSRDTASARDQGASAPGGRVCAWCGVAAPKLLRCGRCKAVLYCSADHQRAAWKAGHKQECGIATAAAFTK